MAMRYEIDPAGPDGMVLAIDDESGLRRVVWDPERARTLNPPPPTPGSAASVDQASGGPAPEPEGYAGQVAPPAQVVPQVETPLPAVSDEGAAAWQAAQSAAPVVPRGPSTVYTPAPAVAPPPAAPGGTTLSKAEVTPGTAGIPYDKAAEDERHAHLLDQLMEIDKRRAAETGIRNEQMLELNKQRIEDEAARKVAQEKTVRYENELNTVVRKELDPSRLVTGIGATVMGLVGIAAAAFSRNPGMAMSRMNAALDRRIQQDVQIQREQKDSMVSMLTRQLGSAQQAEAHYTASVRTLALSKLQANLDNMGAGNQYDDLMKAARDEVQTIDDKAKAASFAKPGTAKYEYTIPKPAKGAGVALNNPTTKELAGLGITPKAWTKGLGAKISAGENAPTIVQAAQTTKLINSDIALLDSLAAANNGTLPTKGAINVPQSLVPVLSRMGYQPGQSAEEVGQILNSYVNQQARSYGGAITESDRESATKETGSSTEGVRRYMVRLRDKNNAGISGALSQQFPGQGQKAFDVLLRDSSNNSGVPSPTIVPFDVHNGKDPKTPEGPPAPPTPSQVAASKEEETRKKVRGAVRKSLGNAFDVTSPNPNYTGME